MRVLIALAVLFFGLSAQAEDVEKGIQPYVAPELAGLSQWFNGPDTTLTALKGNVVLLEFWTYSCINCIRTLPYVVKWDQTYRDQGLVVIGIHTPEFEREKEPARVQEALKQYHIDYLVAQDNHMATWNAYKNRYWPALYLIDKQGQVVYTHFGEGEYDRTERNIQYLLKKQ